MPLLKNILVMELRKFMDEEFSGFKEFPQDENAAKMALANAVYEYSKSVIPPSLTADPAKLAMIGALTGMNEFDKGIDVIKNAIKAYAATLGGGMAPLFAPNPPMPTTLPKLEDIKLEDDKASEKAASEFADIVHDWFTSLKAKNINTGVDQNWA